MKEKDFSVEIRSIDLYKMPNGAHVQFVRNICGLLEVNPGVAGFEKVKQTADELARAAKVEAKCLGLSRKSFKTDEISRSDYERDRLFAGFKAAVRSFRNISVEEMKTAAVELNQLIKDSGLNTRMQLERETGIISHFIHDCETEHAAQVARLGLVPYLQALKEANVRVESELRERLDEKSRHRRGEMKLARAECDRIYLRLVKLVNSVSILELVPDVSEFVLSVNQLIKRYREQVLTKRKRKPVAENKPEEEVQTEDNSL